MARFGRDIVGRAQHLWERVRRHPADEREMMRGGGFRHEGAWTRAPEDRGWGDPRWSMADDDSARGEAGNDYSYGEWTRGAAAGPPVRGPYAGRDEDLPFHPGMRGYGRDYDTFRHRAHLDESRASLGPHGRYDAGVRRGYGGGYRGRGDGGNRTGYARDFGPRRAEYDQAFRGGPPTRGGLHGPGDRADLNRFRDGPGSAPSRPEGPRRMNPPYRGDRGV